MTENKVYVYPSILSRKDLSYAEKMMLSIIFSLSDVIDDKFGCLKTNVELSKFMGINENHTAKLVSSLKSKGILDNLRYNNKRTLLIDPALIKD